MKTIYDIQQFLKRFGTVIYVGDRLATLELMEEEIKELYFSKLIDKNELQVALQVLRHEIQFEREQKERNR
ncbi:YqgQ family protein [Bacillus sp. DNRA2]|uniref:YqgQ family protein n=1 Tax=Bacillus sp. DNRA2 TaxID=2723053 RepID=UPI00145EF25C|nr:YqgQ family protein [Bacillus sp. DNRA2]NMD71843.1 YqgQ family protein [Bacillus sp. DNRA2]